MYKRQVEEGGEAEGLAKPERASRGAGECRGWNWRGRGGGPVPVSYTHLDVYKRQAQDELVMLLSLVADVRVCQMVDPEKTVRFMVPKYVLDALGFAL